MTKVDLDDLITTQEVCEIFGKTRVTINNWKNHEGLPHTHLPGYKKPPIRFPRKRVIDWGREKGKEMPGLIFV